MDFIIMQRNFELSKVSISRSMSSNLLKGNIADSVLVKLDYKSTVSFEKSLHPKLMRIQAIFTNIITGFFEILNTNIIIICFEIEEGLIMIFALLKKGRIICQLFLKRYFS